MTTFTRVSRGTYVGTTDGFTDYTTAPVEGEAIQVRGDPQLYASLKLIESQAPTLFFTPTDYALTAWGSEFVKLSDTVEWAGATFTVKHITTIAPDGYVVAARIVVAR